MAGLQNVQQVVLQSLALSFTLVFSQAAEHYSIVKHPPFYGAQNRGLKNAKYMDKKAASFAICVRDCLLEPMCHSVNYRRCSQLCVLNKDTRIQHPDDFKEAQGNVYFDRNKDTSLSKLPHDITCKTFLEAGAKTSGIYTLTVAQHEVQAYCDMTTDGGGWVVFQRRQDGSVDFYRDWAEYQAGFGDLSGEFWLGNDVIRDLSELSCPWKLHIDLEDWDGSTAWAEHDNFRLEGDLYTLRIGAYKGTAGNSLSFNNGWAFSTKDRDYDYSEWSCATSYRGAWWYFYCHLANLNGEYQHSRWANEYFGITWKDWTGAHASLKACSMKMREEI